MSETLHKLIFKKYTLPKANLGIWKIEESIDKLVSSVILDDEDSKKLMQIRNEEKKREWLTVRLLTNELAIDGKSKIVYSETGKPYLKESSKKLSISHTKNFVAVIIDSSETGIDIQYIEPKLDRIAHKFMSEPELKLVSDASKLEQLSVYWCAKECLYKLYGNKNLDFKKSLLIDPFDYKDSGKISGKIAKEGFVQSYLLSYEKIENNTMLVYILNE